MLFREEDAFGIEFQNNRCTSFGKRLLPRVLPQHAPPPASTGSGGPITFCVVGIVDTGDEGETGKAFDFEPGLVILAVLVHPVSLLLTCSLLSTVVTGVPALEPERDVEEMIANFASFSEDPALLLPLFLDIFLLFFPLLLFASSLIL